MRVVVTTEPQPVVSLEMAKLQMRVDGYENDALIESMVAAATTHLDGPGGWLGRALGQQTLTATLDDFSDAEWRLPFPPVSEIVSVKYDDANGAEQTVDEVTYELRDGVLRLAHGKNWPATSTHSGSVRVAYQAGYPTLPAPIEQAILLMTRDLYDGREAGASAVTAFSPTAIHLLERYRVYS